MTKSTVKKNNVVASLRRLITGARDSGVPVLFAPMAYTEEDYADGGLQRRSGINRLMFEARMFLASALGRVHRDLQSAESEVTLEPHTRAQACSRQICRSTSSVSVPTSSSSPR